MSDEPLPILAPGHFVPLGALAFGGLGTAAIEVSAESPLPVTAGMAAASTAPLSGTLSGNDLIGPFLPELGRAVMLTLTGEWTGTATLCRSTDGALTTLPVTLAGESLIYGDNLQEAVWVETEAGASLWLDVTLTDGALSYRMAQ